MRILFATDFSSHSETALLLLHGLLLPPGTRIRVVHAIEPITTVTLFAPEALLTVTEASRKEGRALVDSTTKRLARPDVAVEGSIRDGRAADVVIAEADVFAPDLIVVGSRGRGAIATTVLGSVSAEIVDRAPCPVLVARRTTLEQVILADDGSVDAAAGAHAIVELAPLRRTNVRVVSVADLPIPLVLADPTGTTASVEAYRDWEAAMPALRTKCAEIARDRAAALRWAGVTATWEQRDGDPAYEVIGAATEQHADCVAIGTRGLSGLRRFVVGSVARDVLFHAPCSVLVAHAKARVQGDPAEREAEPAGAFGKEV